MACDALTQDDVLRKIARLKAEMVTEWQGCGAIIEIGTAFGSLFWSSVLIFPQ